jgi:hypothetical protein
MQEQMLGMPDIELPSSKQREQRARWFSALTDDEREEMIHVPFAVIETFFTRWCEADASAA